MKIFIIEPIYTEYDECESIVILANNEDRAIEIAGEENNFFIDNIGDIKTIDLDKETFICEIW